MMIGLSISNSNSHNGSPGSTADGCAPGTTTLPLLNLNSGHVTALTGRGSPDSTGNIGNIPGAIIGHGTSGGTA